MATWLMGALAALLLTLSAGPRPASGAEIAQALGPADVARMRDVCARAASRRYGVRPGAVGTGRPRWDGRHYQLRGELIERGARVTVACRYGPRGGFDRMVEVERQKAEPPRGPGGSEVSRKEMERFCRREAARRYRVDVARVSVSRAERAGSGFAVTGQVGRGHGRARFLCRFGPRGGFDSMREIG